MTLHIFSIKALTNLHVGSGDASYGPVDKMIQLDPATNFPTIFGQSLKGALREYCAGLYPKKDEDTTFIEPVFGSFVRAGNSKDPEQGAFSFMAADLLAMPAPVTGNSDKAWQLVGSPGQLRDFVAKVNAFGKTPAITEDALKQAINADKWDDTLFNEVANSIPVLARNQLDNGISQNLWYEQFLPHQSVFCTFIISNGANYWSDFNNHINGKVVQIGANATVGYGYCQFQKIG